ncbi:hypothetical protein CRUP_013212 [Coryphaenoides rupestris]|nr:hypothetical protein CRUP_013212 [Coryphaenoides rupestris]
MEVPENNNNNTNNNNTNNNNTSDNNIDTGSRALEEPRALEERRVRVSSRRGLEEQLGVYKTLLGGALDAQPAALSAQLRTALLQELLANFEAAVHDNVLVNGLPWEEAPGDGDEAELLANLLDDTVVEVSRWRRRGPREILPHVVHGLRAQRKLMSIKTLQTQAEGLCQVLGMKPGQATLEVHREVFGHAHGDDDSSQSEVADASPSKASSVRQPIKRAVEETTARNCFVPPTKKTTRE